ncbi:hypothetical protein ACYSUO_05435 [Streptomyces sp. UC4497]
MSSMWCSASLDAEHRHAQRAERERLALLVAFAGLVAMCGPLMP